MGEQLGPGAVPHRPHPKVWRVTAIGLLVAITVVHLLGQLLAPAGRLSDITQIMLMPLLAAVFLTQLRQPPGGMSKLVLLALFFSWLGDSLPRFITGDPGFLTMVGCFLVAQVFYILALWPLRGHSVLSRWRGILPYLGALALLVFLCAPGAGNLLIPVVLYGAALCLMAVLSTGLGGMGGCGGAIFLISDAMIALRSFADMALPAYDFWVMFSYMAGQALLVGAVLRLVHRALDDGARQRGSA